MEVCSVARAVNDGVHLKKINDTSEIAFSADGQLNGNSGAVEALLDHVKNAVEIGAHDVHLVDENHSGNLILVGLAPNGLRLRLNAALCAKNGYGAVQNTQRALNFNGEVNVARSVNDVDSVFLPETGGCGGSDGNTSLLLLSHPVHGCGTVMSLTDFVVNAGVIENSLGSGRFACVDVSHDAYISCFFKRNFSRHFDLQICFNI